MSFQVSPGVQVKETDLTNVVPAVSTSIGAIAGSFAWGPVDQVVTLGSEKQLAEIFGKPDDRTFKHFMPAAQFLQYSNALRVVRADQTGMLNASADGLGFRIRNRDEVETLSFANGQSVVARYPGDLGNSISVVLITSTAAFADPDVVTAGYDKLFSFAPETTSYAEARGVTDDELHVVVVDSLGKWTGVSGTVLEIFEGLSQASDARKDDGSSNFYRTVVNNSSKYIFVGTNDSSLPDLGKPTDSVDLEYSFGSQYQASSTGLAYILAGGTEGDNTEATVGELGIAYSRFEDAETLDVNFIIGPYVTDADDITAANDLVALAEGRKDAIAFVSPAPSRTVNNSNALADVKIWADGVTSSSYAVFDSGALYVYDKYNDKYRWIHAAGSIAGLCANTDNVADPWFSPAGLNRGQIRGVTKIAYNPNKTDRDILYKARINPIVTFPGQGTVLYGDKTALAKPSAFDRINVRRLFITLEKAVATAAKFQLFELNDVFTRAQFKNLVEPFMRDVQGRRGITDFLVVCDETNNTPEVIDTNRFVAEIYIKPARSINFITLNFIATRSGVEFSEIVGQ